MPICALCGETAKLTREHIWSDVILRIFDDVAPLTIDPIRDKVHGGDPVLKDICSPCNGRLSASDGVAGAFVRRYCVSPLSVGRVVEGLGDPELLRWVAKTTCNLDRAINPPRSGHAWWKAVIPFLLGRAPAPPTAKVLFAPWHDLRPEDVREFLQVQTIDAKAMVATGLKCGSWDALKPYFDCAVALKVGYGVFLFAMLSTLAPDTFYPSFVTELCSYGWLSAGGGDMVIGTPFNMLTSQAFFFVSPPDKLDLLTGLSR